MKNFDELFQKEQEDLKQLKNENMIKYYNKSRNSASLFLLGLLSLYPSYQIAKKMFKFSRPGLVMFGVFFIFQNFTFLELKKAVNAHNEYLKNDLLKTQDQKDIEEYREYFRTRFYNKQK